MSRRDADDFFDSSTDGLEELDHLLYEDLIPKHLRDYPRAEGDRFELLMGLEEIFDDIDEDEEEQ